MTTDFRALCAELADRLQHAITSANADSYYGENRDAVDRARAALAQPEPVPPTDEELLKLFGQFDVEGMNGETHGMPLDTFWDEYQPREALAFARAVLARWGTPANTTNQED
jgi:hypothetical protein